MRGPFSRREFLEAAASRAASHSAPRLFLNEKTVARLRQAIQVPGSTHEAAWRQMTQRLAIEEHWFDRRATGWNYGRSARAQAAALAYQLTGRQNYAQLAYHSIETMYTRPDPDRRLPDSGYGLQRAATGMALGVAWNWCRDGWTDPDKAFVQTRLHEALDAWESYRHPNLEDTRGSNWVAVCRGGELALMIGGGEEKRRPERFAFLKEQLRLHMRNGYDEIGVTQEGSGYCGYACSYLMQALLALRSIGDTSLETEAGRHAWWKQLMFAGSFSASKGLAQRLFLMSGVGGATINDEGWASMAIPLVPRDHLPEYLWWFDRHTGLRSPGAPLHRFDWQRGGGLWTLLTYPTDVKADRARKELQWISGAHGTCYFRNRWQDANDIQLSITADARKHGHAWDQPESLQIGLLAGGTVFFGGPGKERDPRGFSTLLVDGNVIGRNGALVSAGAGGAAVRVGDEYARTLGVDFTTEGATILVSDEVRSATPRSYTWQANLDGYPPTAPRLEAQERQFRLTSPSGVLVEGKVLEPVEARIKPGRPLRITCEGKDLRIVVELRVRLPERTASPA